MTKRLALLLAAALAACQPVLQAPAPSVLDSAPAVRSGGFDIRLSYQGLRSGTTYKVAYDRSDIARLVVGIFDLSSDLNAPPSLGYFYPGPSATNPLGDPEFTNLQAALGNPAGAGVDRRYLLKSFTDYTQLPSQVVLTNFPNVSDTSPLHSYRAFATAFDSFGKVIGHSSSNITTALTGNTTVPLALSLNYGGLGGIDVTSLGDDRNLPSGLQTVIVGLFDVNPGPNLGWISDGVGDPDPVAFTGSQTWFPTLRTYLSQAPQSLADTTNAKRYVIRTYTTSGYPTARTTQCRNLPLDGSYRAFYMAIKTGDLDAGHAISGSGSTPDSTTPPTVALGTVLIQ